MKDSTICAICGLLLLVTAGKIRDAPDIAGASKLRQAR